MLTQFSLQLSLVTEVCPRDHFDFRIQKKLSQHELVGSFFHMTLRTVFYSAPGGFLACRARLTLSQCVIVIVITLTNQTHKV